MVASLLKAFLPEALLAYHETLARHSTEAKALLEELSNNSLQIRTVLRGDEGKALFCANTDCNLGRYVTVCEREVVHANTLLQEGLAYIHVQLTFRGVQNRRYLLVFVLVFAFIIIVQPARR